MSGTLWIVKQIAALGLQARSSYPYKYYYWVKPQGEGASTVYEPVELGDYFSPDMVQVIRAEDDFWFLGILGLSDVVMYRTKKFEWLFCADCEKEQLLPAAYGAPAAKRRCHMTPRCEGIMYRIRPEIFSIEKPKRPRKTKRGVVVVPRDDSTDWLEDDPSDT